MHKGITKFLLPKRLVVGVEVGSELGLEVLEDGSVRCQHRSVAHTVPVVVVVHDKGSDGVQVHTTAGIWVVCRTQSLQLCSIGWVQCWIHTICRSWEVVQPAYHLVAVSLPNSMCTCPSMYRSYCSTHHHN